MAKKTPLNLNLFNSVLSQEEEKHINNVSELMEKMDSVFTGYSTPEVYNSLSGMTALVICLSEDDKERALRIVEMLFQHIRENIQIAEQEGNTLWSRKLQ